VLESGDEPKSFGPTAEAPRFATEARSVMRHPCELLRRFHCRFWRASSQPSKSQNRRSLCPDMAPAELITEDLPRRSTSLTNVPSPRLALLKSYSNWSALRPVRQGLPFPIPCSLLESSGSPIAYDGLRITRYCTRRTSDESVTDYAAHHLYLGNKDVGGLCHLATT
jgi:hypothetical protein